jgi:hypothetical protein
MGDSRLRGRSVHRSLGTGGSQRGSNSGHDCVGWTAIFIASKHSQAWTDPQLLLVEPQNPFYKVFE